MSGQGKVSLRDASIFVESRSAGIIKPIAELLQRDLEAVGLGKRTIAFADSTPGKPGIVLALSDTPPAEGLAFPDQAYSIEIGDSVVIRARTATGVFYGTRTLLQMLMAQPKSAELARGRMVDYPKSGSRMLMLDVSRKPFPYEITARLLATDGVALLK